VSGTLEREDAKITMPEKDKVRADRNRRNAIASTGPKSLAGKRKASQNNLSHGLRSRNTVIPGESRKEFEAFQKDVARDLNATSAIEQALSQLVASNMWRLARGTRYEAQSITGNLTREELVHRYEAHMSSLFRESPTRSSLDKLKDGIEHDDETYEKVYRYEEILKLINNTYAGDEVSVEISKEIVRLADTGKEIVESFRKSLNSRAWPPQGLSVKDAMTLLENGSIGKHKIAEMIKEDLAHLESVIVRRKRAYKRKLREYEKNLAAFSARFKLLEKDDLERLQTYENHVQKNLLRTLEAFRQVREIQVSKAAPIEVIAVASNVRKQVDRKTK
jgi:hypothetical protein